MNKKTMKLGSRKATAISWIKNLIKKTRLMFSNKQGKIKKAKSNSSKLLG